MKAQLSFNLSHFFSQDQPDPNLPERKWRNQPKDCPKNQNVHKQYHYSNQELLDPRPKTLALETEAYSKS